MIRNTSSAVRVALSLFASLAVAITVSVSDAQAQKRDYLTEAEVELVRDAQQIDLRIMVLMTAVDRRLAVINGTKLSLKNESAWGPAPEGTRIDLLRDVDGLTQKAVDDIDDVASRNADSEFFPKAVRKFASSCEDLRTKTKSLFDSAKDDKERGVLARISERCADVIGAAAGLPEDPKSKSGKKP